MIISVEKRELSPGDIWYQMGLREEYLVWCHDGVNRGQVLGQFSDAKRAEEYAESCRMRIKIGTLQIDPPRENQWNLNANTRRTYPKNKE